MVSIIDYNENLKNKRVYYFLSSAIILSFLILLSGVFQNISESNSTPLYIQLVYPLIKLAGLIISIMLLWFEIDKYNPRLQNFCGGGNKVNCETVLESKYSKLFNGTISLSSLAFSYFFSTFLILLISEFSSDVTIFIGQLSFITFPAIIVSLYAQGIIIKKWCKFCVVLQAILVIEIVIALWNGFYLFPYTLIYIPSFFVLASIALLGWKVLKPILKQNKKGVINRRNFRRLKYNPNVFEVLLSKSRRISSNTDGLGFFFKVKNPKYHIIKVCNPYCEPCAKAHPVLNELYHNGNINLQIIFTASPDKRDYRALPVSHFLSITDMDNPELIKKVLDEWYHSEPKNLETLVNKYPINRVEEGQWEKIKLMHTWCLQEGITRTLTIFVNGYELPEEYSLKDLKEILK